MTEEKPHGLQIYTVTTSVAAAFNLLILLVICFIVMPRMELSIEESRRNRQSIQANRDLLQDNLKRLEGHREIVIRINQMLDAAAAKQKVAEEAAKRKAAEDAKKKK